MIKLNLPLIANHNVHAKLWSTCVQHILITCGLHVDTILSVLRGENECKNDNGLGSAPNCLRCYHFH